jgi:hypothetical protein
MLEWFLLEALLPFFFFAAALVEPYLDPALACLFLPLTSGLGILAGLGSII